MKCSFHLNTQKVLYWKMVSILNRSGHRIHGPYLVATPCSMLDRHDSLLNHLIPRCLQLQNKSMFPHATIHRLRLLNIPSPINYPVPYFTVGVLKVLSPRATTSHFSSSMPTETPDLCRTKSKDWKHRWKGVMPSAPRNWS